MFYKWNDGWNDLEWQKSIQTRNWSAAEAAMCDVWRMLHDQMSCHQVQTRQICRWGRGNGHGQEHSHSRLGHKMRKNDETYVLKHWSLGLSWQFHKDPKISKASHFYLKDVERISMMLSIHSDRLGTSITPNHFFPSHSHAIFTFTLIIALYTEAGQFYLARDTMSLRSSGWKIQTFQNCVAPSIISCYAHLFNEHVHLRKLLLWKSKSEYFSILLRTTWLRSPGCFLQSHRSQQLVCLRARGPSDVSCCQHYQHCKH